MMTICPHNYLSVGVLITGCLAATPSQAQQVQQLDAAGRTRQSVGDIVVTARRREERLNDVPIAVQAFSSETLESSGVQRATDLVNVVPTLKISSSAQRRQAPSFELRSISSTESPIGQDSPVALYADEVYVPRPIGTTGAFVDLENVQVLLGPQGTLFGRNATAGAILVSSKKPVLGSALGEVEATVGNYNQRRLQAIVNLPVGEDVAIRLVGARNLRDGYTHDISSGQRLHGRPQATRLGGHFIFHARRHFRIDCAGDQTVHFQFSQLRGQHVLGDTGDRLAQLPEAVNPLIEQPHDLQLPLAREHRERAAHLVLHGEIVTGH
nr:TonB-dependent receptor plug domain-containing protein [Sphingobium sp. EM0848]